MLIDLSQTPDSDAQDPKSLKRSIGTEAATRATSERWIRMVEGIRRSDPDAMEELYIVFTRGIRYYLCRHLGPQELDDKVHDTFVIVVQAIQAGGLREPEKLMGFVRTVVRRQVAAFIDTAVQTRRDFEDLELGGAVADVKASPEQLVLRAERSNLMLKVLRSISRRDREILTRFYLYEQPQAQICDEMELTETQFRLLKSRAKTRFAVLGRQRISPAKISELSLRKAASSGH